MPSDTSFRGNPRPDGMDLMIVITRNYGQLGNRLILYAHFIAAAREYGVSLANPCFAEYAEHFPATANDLWCRFSSMGHCESGSPPAWQRRMLSKTVYLGTKSLSLMRLNQVPFRIIRLRGDEECDLGSDWFAEAVRGKFPLLVSGWLFRSQRLLGKHASVIRQHFQVAEHHRQSIDRLMTGLRETADVVVGVHIRHGDYATFMDGRYYYSLAQYANVMRGVVDQLPRQRVTFLVCSNATLPGEAFHGLNVVPGPGHMVEDMYALAETDFMIGPPSTYTGWASFYGETALSIMETADHRVDVGAMMHGHVPAAA